MAKLKKITLSAIFLIFICVTTYICYPPILGERVYTSMARMGTDNMFLAWESPNLGGIFQYRVYCSHEDNIESTDDMLVNGTMLCDWTWNINRWNIPDIPGYYFNVMVKSPMGFMTSYHTYRIGGVFDDLVDFLKWKEDNPTMADRMITTDLLEEDTQKLGLLGLAMMQTNETLSAEIFQALDVDYVMVYFGFLLQGLSGNEGAWPYLMDACNAHTSDYVAMGLEQDNWYGDAHQVTTVFDKAEYINSTSGLYENKWFNSTLVKLLFNSMPTEVYDASNQLEAYYSLQLEGNPYVIPRMDDNGKTWQSHIPDNGEYNLERFDEIFRSENGLFRIYEINYTGL